MTTHKEVLTLALEALKTFHYAMIDAGVLGRQEVLNQGFTAATAIKEALAQQEQEPVAWQVEVLIQGVWTPMGNPQRDKDRAEKLAANPSIPKECRRIIELYTALPKRKPLTEQQIVDLCDGTLTTWEQVRIARAIEAAHSIKEKT